MQSHSKLLHGTAREPVLDGLRGLAILMVVSHHYFQFKHVQGWPVTIIQNTFSLNWTGVDLFFVLSGFLLGRILMDHRDKENFFQTFYIRRVCRIFPVYYTWLALFFIFILLLGPLSNHGWQSWLFQGVQGAKIPKWSYALFMQNFFYAKIFLAGPHWMNITWSLAVEEQFYFILPVLIWLVPANKLQYALTGLILFAPLCRLFLYAYHQDIYAYVLLPCRQDALFLGVLTAYWMRQKKIRRFLEQNQQQLHSLFFVLMLGVIYFAAFANTTDSSEMVLFGYTWMALFYTCLLVISLTAKTGIIVRIMNFMPLRKLGIISYSLYLIHVTVNISLHGLILNKELFITSLSGAIVTMFSLFTSLLIAAISWRYFEKPIVDWGHTFVYRCKLKTNNDT